MSQKLQILLLAGIAGISQLVAWLCTVTPEVQSGILSSLVECVPLQWRPTAAWVSKLISTMLGIYAIYKAHQSSGNQPSAIQPQAGAVQTTIK